MSEFKGTPGPWKWWTSNSFLRLSGADGKDGGVICPTVSSSDRHPDLIVSPADMALIEAAPDLLEALQGALYRLDLLISTGQEVYLDVLTRDKARAAISKATGE
jgi:hypothetical protein